MESVAYVKASVHRQNVMKFLEYGMKTPTEIGVELNVRTNHISNTLAELRKKDLIVCVTPNVRKGRLYKLTELGEDVVEYIH